MTRIIDTIVEIHDVLSQLGIERKRLEGVPDPMRELHEEHQSLEADIERLETEAQEAEVERRASELAASECQDKIAHYQQQISRVTTQREYGALLAEIDTVSEQKKEQEELALTALERQESSSTEKESLKARFEEVDGQYRVQLKQWEIEKPAVGENIERLEAQSEVLRETLAAPVLNLFDRLWEQHNGAPMAKVIKVDRTGSGPTMWRCNVCNYSVRPQAVVQIQTSGELITCDCGRQRIFYLEDDS